MSFCGVHPIGISVRFCYKNRAGAVVRSTSSALTETKRWRLRMATLRLCSIPDCGKPSRNRGWCVAHYTRWRRHGDPGIVKKQFHTKLGHAQIYYRDVVRAYSGDECLIWPFSTIKGYAGLGGRYVHRILCTEEFGPAPTPEHEAAHSCGKGHLACVAKSHISWKTPSMNQMDRVRHGTSNRGERHPRSKLTEAAVLEIRALHGKLSLRKIASMFDIHPNSVYEIQARKRWAWL